MAKIVFKDGQELHVTDQHAQLLTQSGQSGLVDVSVQEGDKEKHFVVSMSDVLYFDFEKAVPAQPAATTSAPAEPAPATPEAQPAATSEVAPAQPAAPADATVAPADPSAQPAA